MTPLIQEMMQFAKDPRITSDYIWFDMGVVNVDEFPDKEELDKDEDKRATLDDFRLPFPYTGLCYDDLKAKCMMMLTTEVKGSDGIVITTAYKYNDGREQYTLPCRFYPDEDGYLRANILGVPPETAKTPPFQQYINNIANISKFYLSKIHGASHTAYKWVAKNTPMNRTRIAKGKMPYSIDWHTLEIKPSLPRSEHKGGTHASPRQHDRRGHWRTRGGKQYWVRACVVGDPVKGRVYKDYKTGAHEGTQCNL